MGKNRKPKYKKPPMPPPAIKDQLRTAIRTIVREWQSLRQPLPVVAIPDPVPNGAQRYRVLGIEFHEDLQKRVAEFAGLVWQLKDGLIEWLRHRPDLTIKMTNPALGQAVVGTCGDTAAQTIEELAKCSISLMLCADIYNGYKHYADCDRSGYSPCLSELWLDLSNAGEVAAHIDGATKTNDFTVKSPEPVPFWIDISSRKRNMGFGDAVVNIGRGFVFWITLMKNVGLLSSDDAEDKAIVYLMDRMEREVAEAKPFRKEGRHPVVKWDQLTPEELQLANVDPDAFLARVRPKNASG
jgi:hypothetical protein